MTRSIRQPEKIKCTKCALYVSIEPSVTLESGDVVTISGLLGSATASSASLELSDSQRLFGTTGVWNQGLGVLLLQVAPGKRYAPGSRGKPIEIEIRSLLTPSQSTMLNSSPLQPPQIRVSVESKVAEDILTGDAFFRYGEPQLIQVRPAAGFAAAGLTTVVSLVFDSAVRLALSSSGTVRFYARGSKRLVAAPILCNSTNGTMVVSEGATSRVSGFLWYHWARKVLCDSRRFVWVGLFSSLRDASGIV